MRSLTGPKAPDKPADPIIVHPDVRRMLLTMKAFNEGNRALAYFTAQLLDTEHLSQDAAERERAADLLAFLTPICKAFMTETGQEVTNLGMQVYGGHGYIREWGMEQLVRDCRIAQIYEGTNGIQALDLLGRKVLGSQGKLLRGFTKLVHQLCQAQAEHPQLKGQVAQLAALNAQWGELTQQVGLAAMKNADEVGAALGGLPDVLRLRDPGLFLVAHRPGGAREAGCRQRRGRVLRSQAGHRRLLLQSPAAAHCGARRGDPGRRGGPDEPVGGAVFALAAAGAGGAALLPRFLPHPPGPSDSRRTRSSPRKAGFLMPVA